MVVRVRNLRVAVILIRDAVTVVVAVLGVRLTVVIGVQLELGRSLVRAAVRVGHRDRNIELFLGVLVQLRLVRERNGDLTGVLINLDFVALRSREVLTNGELRTFRSLRVLTVLISEGRGRLGFLTRNNQFLFVGRLVVLAVNRFELYEQVARVTGNLNSCSVTELAVLLELQVILVDVVKTGYRNRVLALWKVLRTKVLNERVFLSSAPGFTVVVGLEFGSIFRRQRDDDVTDRLREFFGRVVVTVRFDDCAVDLHAESHTLRVSFRCIRVVWFTVIVAVWVRRNTVTIVVLHNVEDGLSAGDNTALGLRLARLVLDRVAVLVENWNLQSLVTHHNWEVECLTSLVSVRGEGHDTGRRVNRDLVFSDALRQLAELELCLFRLGFLRPGFWVVKLRLRGSLFVCLGIDWVVLEVITRDRKSVHRENQVVLRIWIAVSNLQASSERVTRLGVHWNLELAARDHGCGVGLVGLTRLDDLAVLVDPLDVVVQVIGDRKASSIGLDLITERGPVVSGVLVDNVELQSLRSKSDVPTGVAISGITNVGTVTTEELCVSTSIQVSTEARARPLAKRPRVQRTDVVRQRVAILVKNADVAPVHIDVLGIQGTVSPSSLTVGTCELSGLICRNNSTAVVGVAVDTLPPQLELTVSTGGGGQSFCDPGFWIRCYLLVNPALQALLILDSPALTTQGLACEVGLRVRLNLVHRVIGEVGANNLQSCPGDVLSSKGAHGVVVQSALQNVKVPESSTRVGTTVTTSSGAFHPLVIRQVLRQLVLLGVLDGHAGDLVATPGGITLGGRRRVCANAREDTSCRLVHQTVLIRHVFRKLRPDADLLTVLVPAPVTTVGGTYRGIRTELTINTFSIGVRRHLDGEVTVFIALGVVHRGRVLSVFTLVPLGVDLNTLQRLTGSLNVTKTNLGLYDFLHGTGDSALLASLAWRVDGLIRTSFRRSSTLSVGYLRFNGGEYPGCESSRHSQAQACCRNAETPLT